MKTWQNNRKMKMLRIIVFATILLIVLSLSALATKGTTTNDRASIGIAELSAASLNSNGTWTTVEDSSASRGRTISVKVPITLGSGVLAGEEFEIKVDGIGLDFADLDTVILIEKDGVQLSNKIDFSSTKSSEDIRTIVSTILIEPLMLEAKTKVSLYFTAECTTDAPRVSLSLKRVENKSFENNEIIHIGDYAIRKNTGSNISLPAGMGGIAKADRSYTIYKNGEELVRVIVVNNRVMGLAKTIDSSVHALNFDVTNKVYKSAISQAAALTRDEMQEVFDFLDFSYLRTPDEKMWLSWQDTYSSTSSLNM